MDMFNDNLFDLIPNPFATEETVKIGERRVLLSEETRHKYCNLNLRLIYLDIECLILNNSGNIVFEFLIYILVKVILFLVISCGKAKGSTYRNYA
jgi:hypothetical protein